MTDIAVNGADQLLAHHAALLAIPALVPAVVVVGAILFIARRDRLAEREEADVLGRALDGEPSTTHPPEENR